MKRTLASLFVVSALSVGLLPLAAQAGIAAPANLAPDDDAVYQKNVVLTWDEVGGATSYDVQVTNDGFGTEGVVFEDTAASNRYVMPVDLPRGDYQWRVRASIPGGSTDWSDTAVLLRGWDPSIAPVVSQLGGAYDWSVSWTPVPDASFYEVEYSKESTEADNTAPTTDVPAAKGDVITCFTTHTTFVGYLLTKGSERTVAEGATCTGDLELDPTTYTVRVRARDGVVDDRSTPFPSPSNTCTGAWQAAVGAGWTGTTPECSAWSNEITGLALKNSSTEPAQPSGLATSDATGTCDASDPCTDTPVMTWPQDPDATLYRVYLSRDRSGFDVDRLYANVIGTSFQMPDTLTDRALPWYWRVQACSAVTEGSDACGPISDAASFTVENQALTDVGASPVSGDPVVKEQHVDFAVPTEIVDADHQAKAFRLQVSTKADFSSIVHSATFDHQAGDAAHTTYRWDGASDGSYYWRYRAIDQTGLTSPWTQGSTLTFSVNAAIPKVSIKTSSGWGLTDSITLVSEKPLDGVTSSSLGVTLKDGARLTGRISVISSSSWSFEPDGRWIPGAAYVPYVAATVTASSNGKVAVSDDVARRPAGMVDSKSPSMKTVDGDFAWKTLTASDAIGSSYVAAKHSKSSSKVPYASVKFGGSAVTVYACKSSANGIADVYIDGAKVKSLNLYRATSKCGEVWSKTGLADTVHTIQIKVTGQKSAESSGTYVGVDAVKAG